MREVLRREWLVASRSLGQLGRTLLFMLLVVTLFPLAISPERQVLEQVGLGALWIMSLLAMLSAAEQTIAPDLEQGVADHMVCGSVPLWWQVIAKVLMHWLTIGLPIVLVSPIIGLMLSVDAATWPFMMVSLLLTTPIISLLCVFGASLTAGLGAGPALMPIVVAPMMLPALILGTQWTYAQGATGHGYALAALLSFTSIVIPWATAGAIRTAAER